MEEKAKWRHYWITVDIDGADRNEFKNIGTPEDKGITLEFDYALFERFTPRSIGMDFTEVNFELIYEADRKEDENTFKEMFEIICHQVIQPIYSEDQLSLSERKTYKNKISNIWAMKRAISNENGLSLISYIINTSIFASF